MERSAQLHPAVRGLEAQERKALASRADEVELAQGRAIVREGDWAYEFFAIDQGTCEVRRGDQLLGELGPGDFFGEMALVGDTRRNATVVATTPLKVVVMTAQAFRQTKRELPGVASQIEAAIEERARALDHVS